ncbi:FAD-binding protein [Neobacillus kokaensis]|uniref:L-gulonolactone oxidase n=1 Tax=Neobacillus kokaensis TaxID=2759023 RepID=A0ABQ3N8Z0_9BACI|nr:FAD-binding oxidoreductase [Neobacillus kokaensis]GHI00426.1 L-gulonolactone oxidase [Neobacillus kokaensis]
MNHLKIKTIKRVLCILVLLLSVVFLSSYSIQRYTLAHYQDDLYENGVIQDVARLLPTKIERMETGKEEKQIVDIIKRANEEHLPVSISGNGHSQGGHTYYPNAVVLDMTQYNRVLAIDPKRKTIHVQSGATWDQIQKALAPYGLAVKVMQSQNIFTVGGSISANIHGRDIHHESLGSTINWFRLLLADGRIVKVDRETNPELFHHVIGGYGLFGVILDVELQVTDDEIYEMISDTVPVQDFPEYVKKLRANPNVKLAYGRISTAPRTLLDSIFVVEYHQLSETLEQNESLRVLKHDEQTWLTEELLNFSRKTQIGKDVLWDLQTKYFLSLNHSKISRNNSMRSESDFLLYKNPNNTDVLQEFFVPIDEFPAYIEDLKVFLDKDDINLLNLTIRYVSKDDGPALSYARDDMIALVALFNHGKKKEDVEKAQRSIQEMIDITLKHNGTFYLPYYPYATKEQLIKSYPKFPTFVAAKEKYDPKGLFMNLFYERYRYEE